MFADEGLGPFIQHRWATTIKHRTSLAKGQKQEIEQRIGDTDCSVWRQIRCFAKRGMHEVMRDPAGAGTRRKFAGCQLRRMKTAFLQQFRWYNDYFVPRQRWADDGMRTGYIISEIVTGR
jgi:hypothetical protein